MTVPATRSLTAVLRDALNNTPAVRLVVGQFAAPDPSAAYCNVTIQGQTLRIPKLFGVTATQGKPAYLLATKDQLICIGTVSA